jgi:hypothetical protein
MIVLFQLRYGSLKHYLKNILRILSIYMLFQIAMSKVIYPHLFQCNLDITVCHLLIISVMKVKSNSGAVLSAERKMK